MANPTSARRCRGEEARACGGRPGFCPSWTVGRDACVGARWPGTQYQRPPVSNDAHVVEESRKALAGEECAPSSFQSAVLGQGIHCPEKHVPTALLLSMSLPPEFSQAVSSRIRLTPSNGALPKLFHSFPSVRDVHASFPASQRSSPQTISHGFLSVHDVHASVSVPAPAALPKLFPTVSCPPTISTLPSRSLPSDLSHPSTVSTLLSRSFRITRRPRFRLAPSQRSSPMLSPSYFPVAHPSTVSTLPSRSLPTELSPSYFPRFLSVCSPRLHPAPSQQSSPQAISRPSTLSSLPSCPPNGPLLKLFPTVSRLSTQSSLPSRSLSTELSPSFFPRFPVRPPCRRFRIISLPRCKIN